MRRCTRLRPPRIASALLALCLALTSACEKRNSDTSALRVALLTPGPISDQSWNGGAYQGLLWTRDSLGASISHIQTRTPAEFEENFRQYGAQGYTVVFGHGFEFQDAALRVAPDYPNTLFVTTSGTTTGPNLAGIRFAFEEPSFIAGVLAAIVSKTRAVGVIGGTELPPVRASFEAFAAGARSVDPNIRFVSSYVGNWDDAGAGKEQALAQIASGVDVIFQNADAAGLGVFQAARDTRKAWVIGSNADQNHVAPEVTLGSVLIDLPKAFLLVVREIKDGTFTPRVIALASPSGVVQFLINPAIVDSLTPAALAAVDSVRSTLQSGTLRIPVASRDSTQ